MVYSKFFLLWLLVWVWLSVSVYCQNDIFSGSQLHLYKIDLCLWRTSLLRPLPFSSLYGLTCNSPAWVTGLVTGWSSPSSHDVDVPNPRPLLYSRILFSELDSELTIHFGLLWRQSWLQSLTRVPPPPSFQASTSTLDCHCPHLWSVNASWHWTLSRCGLTGFLEWPLPPVTLLVRVPRRGWSSFAHVHPSCAPSPRSFNTSVSRLLSCPVSLFTKCLEDLLDCLLCLVLENEPVFWFCFFPCDVKLTLPYWPCST